MNILIITNLYPPHHAGTFDMRCESVAEALRLRGHRVLVLTSNHAITSEQRDELTERRLWLNGVYDHPPVTAYRDLLGLEQHNHRVLGEAIASFRPDLAYVWSLHGLSKSLMFGLRNARLPIVYDVADDWLANGIREDPWLRWWNAPGTNLSRASLELTGQRHRLDESAPTRLARGYDRLPDVYGPGAARGEVKPESVLGFRFERLHFCSLSVKQAAFNAGFRVGHGEVIHPGISTEQYVGEIRPAEAPLSRFLMVTAMEPRNGVTTAVNALAQARANGFKASLSLVGRGDSAYLAELRSLVVRQSLPVEFLTVSNINRDLPAIYRQHDAYLHLVEWEEPYALGPLQAMACGLPLISTTCGGMRDILRHGENSLFCLPGDPLELAVRIRELQSLPGLRRQLAETAQADVLARYNQAIVTDQVEDYLCATLETWQHA